ncbi:MAG: TolC family protein, partial [Gemmatimonadetes bacterium]|nr:TolC family protein [Gemmatimonadota bacterium]
ARAGLQAAVLRVEIARARIRYDVLAAYAHAASACQIVSLSAQQAAHGAELLRITRARRDVGDASDLDVDLAEVSAAQLISALLSDSLRAVTATLELQGAMGLPVDSVLISPVDTVPVSVALPPNSALAVAAGEAEQRAAERRLTEQLRSRLPVPALRLGVEKGDPAGESSGLLPMIGVSLPLPIFHRNGGAVGAARAAADRAAAELAQARRDAALAVAVAERERAVTQARLAADRTALASAQRVATRSLAAYREGAFSLSAVLDAQRSAWEAARQVLEDIAAFRSAEAAVALARFVGVRP